MCPQLYHRYRPAPAVAVEPELSIRGAAASQQPGAGVPDDSRPFEPDDVPPPLEPIDPPLPITGRTPVTPSRGFTIYRGQGISTTPPTTTTSPRLLDGRRSRLRSRWSDSELEDNAGPTYEPLPSFSLPWTRQPLGNITCLEQYLVIVVDGERLFFRLSIHVERTSRGFRPAVSVDFMNYLPAERTFQTDVWLLFATQLEETLLREVDRAFRRAGARRGSSSSPLNGLGQSDAVTFQNWYLHSFTCDGTRIVTSARVSEYVLATADDSSTDEPDNQDILPSGCVDDPPRRVRALYADPCKEEIAFIDIPVIPRTDGRAWVPFLPPYVCDPVLRTVVAHDADLNGRQFPLAVYFSAEEYTTRRTLNKSIVALTRDRGAPLWPWFGPIVIMRVVGDPVDDFVDIDPTDLRDVQAYFGWRF
ncbi:hypothetical protein OH76DRAFT_1484607 [Lentinus brumalis]|uniref:Uncharacterized protein n=1 Tax=Lentinus brumalis TaxID=2498619 RepID=A0A371D4I6_9APHY|nr:hypothetical protein OH76DRAFT_1484607 [Polyporus brumalis]